MREEDVRQFFEYGGEVGMLRPDEVSDPVITEMVRVRGMAAGERNVSLEPYLERWVREERNQLEVARYLAAAGLNLEEAIRLDRHVRTRVHTLLRRKAYRDISVGFVLLAVGFLLVFISQTTQHLPGIAVLLLGIGVAAAASLSRGVSLLRRITPAPDEA